METEEARLKRLRMRAWRRGIREMDLILGNWADENLHEMSEKDLATFDQLLSENDHDLYAWVTEREAPPMHFAPIIRRIAGMSADNETH